MIKFVLTSALFITFLIKFIFLYVHIGNYFFYESIKNGVGSWLVMIVGDILFISGFFFITVLLERLMLTKLYKGVSGITTYLLDNLAILGLKISSTIIVLTIFFLYLLDVLAIMKFQTRLSVDMMLPFITGEQESFLIGYIIYGVMLFISMFFIGFVGYKTLIPKRFLQKHWRTGKAIIGICLAVFFMIFLGVSEASTQIFSFKTKIFANNVIAHNIGVITRNNPKIGEVKNSKKYEEYFGYTKGKGQSPNIILVFAESFSKVDSQRAGGLNDNLPLFDKIQEQGITFTNFISHGSTSERSHIAVLQGVIPLQFGGIQKNLYDTYKHIDNPLPIFMNQYGYSTWFFSTVSLKFLNQGKFLKTMGFDNVIDDAHFTGYKTQDRYVFGALPDHILYDKVVNTIDTIQEPYFIALQTISSHEPYNTPLGRDEQSMWKYVDESIYDFYNKLEDRNFFDDGILIIVSDHRKREAITTDELEKYGLGARTKITNTIVGKGIPKGIYYSGIFQHIDVYESIKNYIGNDDVIQWKLYNDIFDGTTRRDWAVEYSPMYHTEYMVLDTNNNFKPITESNNQVIDFITSFVNYQIDDEQAISYAINTSGEIKKSAEIAIMQNTGTVIIGHRGAFGYAPENSITGFLLAKELGAHGIEFDVSWTKDGHNMVMHGPSMTHFTCRTISSTGTLIQNLTKQQIQEDCTHTDGSEITDLRTTLESINGLFDIIFLEIKVREKNRGITQTLDAINTVKSLNMQHNVIFISYDPIVNLVLGSYEGILAGWDRDGYQKFENMLDESKNYNHGFILSFLHLFDENKIKEIQSQTKKQIVGYTVKTAEEMKKALDMGINILLVGDIKLAKEVLENY